MAIPASTSVWTESMDPYDIVDYSVDCSNMLETGETIASFSLNILAEASVLGLQIKLTDGYNSELIGNTVRMWLTVLPAEQANPAFDGGAILPIELVINTNSTPPRRKQRTLGVKVIQR